MEEIIDGLLKADIIERATEFSAWQSPIVVAPKRNGSLRLCVDMRKVNEAIIRQPHPFPSFEQLTTKFHGAALFSKLDIENAFHHVELQENSRHLTTFVTHKGTFWYKRLMFGLCNAPELFQRVMEFILTDLPGVMVYMDDVIVFGRSMLDHNENLRQVLKRFDEKGIRLNVEKCELRKTALKFLGHDLSTEGIAPEQGKIESLMKCRAPNCKEELQSFLGTVSYLGSRFIPNLATLTEPLRRLTHKGAVFSWEEVHQTAFESLKKQLSDVTMLRFFATSGKTGLFADASPYGVGAVLVQWNDKGEIRPIAFASKSLSVQDQALSQTERETIALVWRIEHFDFYLKGRKFHLYIPIIRLSRSSLGQNTVVPQRRRQELNGGA